MELNMRIFKDLNIRQYPFYWRIIWGNTISGFDMCVCVYIYIYVSQQIDIYITFKITKYLYIIGKKNLYISIDDILGKNSDDR